MSELGRFYGVGVGPGPAGLVPVAAVDALRKVDVIYLPRARSSETSVARQCLLGLDLPEARFREIEFNMDPDRSVLGEYYGQLAKTVAADLHAGLDIAWVTIGDSMTYSTYGYLLAALKDEVPLLEHLTFPGVTSFAATAAALDFQLGVGKERILILPCPDEMEALQSDIFTHDIVVLMKIGKRLESVLDLLRRLDILQHCVFARRIGLPGELLCANLAQMAPDEANGYLSTMLVRRNPKERRHA
jgi:precorrin-2/cobalt-factor-2 C20-methyltransferase